MNTFLSTEKTEKTEKTPPRYSCPKRHKAEDAASPAKFCLLSLFCLLLPFVPRARAMNFRKVSALSSTFSSSLPMILPVKAAKHLALAS
jgi:hypothetical protein